jgi:DNA-binding NarL/FixJ family response regulator
MNDEGGTMLAPNGGAGRTNGDRNGATESAPKQVRLMVVDDHPAVRWGLEQLLEAQRDFSVNAVCISAEGVIARAEAERIDVAIVDYSLGGRNGLWVCRQLKRLPHPPRVIIFSAFANDHLAACCIVAEADAVLNKGVLGSELCDAVRSVMRGRRLLPRVSPPLAGALRCRLADDEQVLFGMLLAGIPRAEIWRILDTSARELDSREDAMLRKLEALPGEPSAIGRPRRIDLERLIPQRRASSPLPR